LTRKKKRNKIIILNMKKLLFILFIAVFLGSCKGEFDNVTYTVKNDSSKKIEFTFIDITYNLDNGESITYIINSEQSRFVPENIVFDGHKKSIYFKKVNQGTAGIEYTFKDTPRLNLNVINKLSIPVTIEDDFIAASAASDTDATDDTDDTDNSDNTDTNNDGDQFILTTLTIEEHNSKTAFIYTSTPKFTIVSPDTSYFNITIEWKLKDDTISVTIK